MSVVAMSRKTIVAIARAGKRRDSGGFLTDVDMVMSAELFPCIQIDERFFKVANEEHAAA
jgi:hypothetical protein